MSEREVKYDWRKMTRYRRGRKIPVPKMIIAGPGPTDWLKV